MEYALLIGVIVFLIAMIAYGYMRGFIKIILTMVATIATIVLAAVLTIPSIVARRMERGLLQARPSR